MRQYTNNAPDHYTAKLSWRKRLEHRLTCNCCWGENPPFRVARRESWLPITRYRVKTMMVVQRDGEAPGDAMLRSIADGGEFVAWATRGIALTVSPNHRVAFMFNRDGVIGHRANKRVSRRMKQVQSEVKQRQALA